MSDSFDPSLLAPLVLAYVGDAVFELEVRAELVRAGVADPDVLHQRAVSQVRAVAQAGAWRGIRDRLTPEEAAIARRGRNAKTGRHPRGTTSEEYHDSTAFEALLGYLYLGGQADRLKEIMALARSMGEEAGPR
ncbi:MAG: Mini-ribonuclease 3 [Bacillota bacterium]